MKPNLVPAGKEFSEFNSVCTWSCITAFSFWFLSHNTICSNRKKRTGNSEDRSQNSELENYAEKSFECKNATEPYYRVLNLVVQLRVQKPVNRAMFPYILSCHRVPNSHNDVKGSNRRRHAQNVPTISTHSDSQPVLNLDLRTQYLTSKF